MLIPHVPLEWMSFYNEAKFWGTLGGILIGLYKVGQRIRDVIDKDIPTLNTNITEVKKMLGEQTERMDTNTRLQTATIMTGFRDQTAAVVGELKEQRQDFRTFFVPPVMARNAPVRRKPAKAK